MSASSPTGPASGNSPSHGKRNLLIALLAVLIVAGVAGGGYGLWYILIGPSAPAAVGTPALPVGATIAAPASLDGTWNVNVTLGNVSDGSATFAGYRVQEQLVGVGGHTAVGRTPKVSGSMTLTGTVVSDNQLHGQALETDTFPTATFALTQPIDLGKLPTDGTSVSASATGTLTLHGVTKTVTVALQAVRQGGIIAVTGSLPIVFSDYSIQKPNSFSVLSVDDHGTMELHLLFTHA
jgi:polyisoprenoid-binding protein YceI